MKPKLTTRILKYLLITSAAIALIWTALQGYSAPWTGFGDFTKPNSDFTRGKTLWDWMQLFIIPIFLSVGVFLLNHSERDNEREIAADRQREAAFQSYLDRMADLLLKGELRITKNEEVRDVARIRTLSVLRGLDAQRKGMVLLFLHEAGLINGKAIINMAGADLSGANLKVADLSGADLSNANLNGANLRDANLSGADLSNGNLSAADLRRANLRNSDLRSAILNDANMRNASLIDANVGGAKLVKAHLNDATLVKTNFSSADLNDADLSGANMNGADLTYAQVTEKQLDTIEKPLNLITWPDGTKYERQNS